MKLLTALQLERLLKRRLRRTQNCKSLSFPRLCRWDKEQLRHLTSSLSMTITRFKSNSPQVAAPLLVRQEAVEASCTSLLRWYLIGRKWFSAAPLSVHNIFSPVMKRLRCPRLPSLFPSRTSSARRNRTIRPKSVCNTNNLLDPDYRDFLLQHSIEFWDEVQLKRDILPIRQALLIWIV